MFVKYSGTHPPINQQGERETILNGASGDTIHRRQAKDFDILRQSAGNVDEGRCCTRELDVSPAFGCTGGTNVHRWRAEDFDLRCQRVDVRCRHVGILDVRCGF